MSLQDDFFNIDYRPEKASRAVLQVAVGNCYSKEYYFFDFTACIVLVKEQDRSDYSRYHTRAAIPFSQMDADVLEKHWQKLTELGGQPPSLARTLDKPVLRQMPPPNKPGI